MYEYKCICGRSDDFFIMNHLDFGCETYICSCGSTMGNVIANSNRMLYFEEGRGRVMNNLGAEPVVVHSHHELEKKMKEKGLEFAGCSRGTKGSWI